MSTDTQTTFLLVLNGEGDDPSVTYEPRLDSLYGEDILCPRCGKRIESQWADDGESDLADWFACEEPMGGCGATGALVRRDRPQLTQNGIDLSDPDGGPVVAPAPRMVFVDSLPVVDMAALLDEQPFPDGVEVSDDGDGTVTVEAPTRGALLAFLSYHWEGGPDDGGTWDEQMGVVCSTCDCYVHPQPGVGFWCGGPDCVDAPIDGAAVGLPASSGAGASAPAVEPSGIGASGADEDLASDEYVDRRFAVTLTVTPGAEIAAADLALAVYRGVEGIDTMDAVLVEEEPERSGAVEPSGVGASAPVEREDNMTIRFLGEAYEIFRNTVDGMQGYGVTIKLPDEPDPFDAILMGADRDAEDGATVFFLRVVDGEYDPTLYAGSSVESAVTQWIEVV